MAFTLQSSKITFFIKNIILGIVISVTAVTVFAYQSQSKEFREVFSTSGSSMLPNYWPEQILTGNSQFKDIQRDAVYMTSDIKYRQTIGEQSTNAVSTKRIVGMPGDVMTFDVTSGTLLSINQQPVQYEKVDGYSSIQGTDTINKVSITASPFLQKTASGGYMLYQLTPEQVQKASSKQRELIGRYTSFGYLKSAPRDSQGNASVTLKQDEYFLLSDNRLVGIDSRYYGPVKRDEVMFLVETAPTPELAKINKKPAY